MDKNHYLKSAQSYFHLYVLGFFMLFSLTDVKSQVSASGKSFSVRMMEQQRGNPAYVEKYEKVELGIKLPEIINEQVADFIGGKLNGLNPYDPEDISIEINLLSPGGLTKKLYGFYYRDFSHLPNDLGWAEEKTDYPWRIRLALDEIGQWKYQVKTLINNVPLIGDTIEYLFFCQPSTNPGYLEVGYFKKQLRFSGSKESFFAIGENIAWPDEINTDNYWSSIPLEYKSQQNYFNELWEAGGNYARVVMAPWGSTVEWEKLGNYHQRQPHLWELDKIFEIAENSGIYVHLCMDMHSNYEDWTPYGVPVWAHNPYKTIPGINTVVDFLTSATAKEIYKKRLRYLVARYGYSTNLAVYELTSEADKMGTNDTISGAGEQYNSDTLFRKVLGNWHKEMIHYIKYELKEKNHMFSTSYAGQPLPDDFIYSLPDIDIVSRHRYGHHRNINLIYRYNELHHIKNTNQGKPIILGEMGAHPLSLDGCDAVSFHNAIWSTAFMGCFGTGLNWTWDQAIHANGFQSHFKAVRNFFNGIDFEKDDFHPQRSDFDRKKNPLCLAYCTREELPLEYFTLVNTNGSKAMGWVHNRSFYWANLENNSVENCFSSYEAPFDDDTLNAPRSIDEEDEEPIIIRGLQPLKKYIVEIYNCYGSGGKLETLDGIHSSINGTLRFYFPMSNKVKGSDNYPDYAYKINLSSTRLESDLVDTIILSSVTLNCPPDTFDFNIALDEHEMDYNYKWDFGNGHTSILANPSALFTNSGDYLVKLSINNNNGRSYSVSQTIIVPDCPIESDTAFPNSFTLYPNPNEGHFFIELLSEVGTQSPKVFLFNVFGSLVQNITIENKLSKVDISGYAKGLYFVRIIFENEIVNQKIIYR